MILTNLFLGLNAFAYIFVKAFQQKNVIYNKYWWMIPCSWLMGLSEVYVIAAVAADATWITGLCIGTGGGIGCILSCKAHKGLDVWLRNRKNSHSDTMKESAS